MGTMRVLYHRMPVILSTEAFEPWLAGDSVRLGPAPEDLLVTHRAGRRVNNPRDDAPECVVALAATWNGGSSSVTDTRHVERDRFHDVCGARCACPTYHRSEHGESM